MHIPSATYRLQFNPDFGFEAARRIIPYLAELGISTVYASPIFKARKGSTHGYDVTDPNQINPELGSEEEFDALIETVHQHGLGWLQDFVPNHMAYDSDNDMLMDIFEKGRSSRYFGFFDIDWDHIRENLRGKVIAPFLGKPYGETLESGELKLEYDRRFAVRYYETLYPLNIKSYATIIAHRLDELKEQLGDEHQSYIKALAVASLLKNLPSDANDAEAEERNAQLLLAQETLWELYQRDDCVRRHLDGVVATFNENVDLLHGLLAEQWFQLTYWRVATKEINYQRFFNINELISLRMEDPSVFDHVHRLALELLREGKINGLRIDHVDGLYDPTAYLARLRWRAADAYVVVEKILELREPLPEAWPVEGTTGYEFMNYVNGLFVDTRNGKKFQDIYSRFGGEVDYEDLLYEKKKLIIERHLTGDLDNLTSLLKTVSTTTRDAIDLTGEAINAAIVEAAAAFPVYRTYVDRHKIEDRDRAYIRDAVEKARKRNPSLDRALLILEKVLLLDFPDYLEEEQKAMWLSFVMRFQQFTSPLMAKGLEDTTFYVFNRLVSLNEVGGNPSEFGVEAGEFHSFNRRRSNLHPATLNATATHDTKRGEDLRARINVLSEIPDQWAKRVGSWQEMNRKYKTELGGELVPGENHEYFLYQTMVGALPFDEGGHEQFIERVKQYAIKAAREAKTHTFWLDNNQEYESALIGFIEAALAQSPLNEFLKDLRGFQRIVAHFAVFNSLSQVVLKITSPGAPDFYQGTELWDLSLVDPDNRRPVDYERRARALGEISIKGKAGIEKLLAELLSTKEDGRIKMFTIKRALGVRDRHKELFGGGDYIPLKTEGRHGDNVIAFARRAGNLWSITIAPRLLTSVVKADELPLGKEAWKDASIEMPDGAPAVWRNAFTEEIFGARKTIPVADALRRFPVSLLMSER
jgi:(1->4)-alpha-D-glucan 1-alpha-D-glucosylmutase